MKKNDIIKNILSYNKGGELDIGNIIKIAEHKETIMYIAGRNNGQQLLVLAFSNSTKLDSWFWFIPTEEQVLVISKSVDIIKNLNIINDKVKQSIL